MNEWILLKIRKKFPSENLERWIAVKSTYLQLWVYEFGSQQALKNLDMVSCMPAACAYDPSTVWGRDKRVARAWWPLAFRVLERPGLRGVSQRVIEDFQCLPVVFMCACRHVYTYVSLSVQKKLQNDI